MMSENQERIQEQPKTRITRITMGRVYNLGNYENQRVEISVDIANGDNPANVFKNLQGILSNLRAKSGVEQYQVRRAHEVLAKPEADLSDYERSILESSRECVAKANEAAARRQAAQAALATLEYTFEHKDHKLDWEDEDDYGDD